MTERHPRAVLRAAAGPALVAVAVVAVLHQFAFQGLVGKGDPVSFFLPRWCALGRALRAGHVLLWDPSAMGGAPFASDPQSGWTYLLPMLLFTLLPCHAALLATVVLLPVVGGVGLLLFLRGEGLSRAAAAAGGVALALVASGSALIYSLPFTGTLAWTAVLLAAASRLVRARGLPARLAWTLGTALAWGQLAGAHFSVGLAMGTGALLAYLAAGLLAPRRPPREAAGLLGLLAGATVAVNLAVLLPRLAFLRETALAGGYAGLVERAAELGHPALAAFRGGTSPAWPLQLGLSNGASLGALVALTFCGFAVRRLRPLVTAFAGYGGVAYLLSLDAVAHRIPDAARTWAPVDAYLHRPEWTGYGLLLALAVLGAAGVEAWARGGPARRLLLLVAPGAALWFALPAALGDGGRLRWLPLAGLGALALALAASVRRPGAVALVPVLVAVQLGVNSLLPFREPPFGPAPELLRALPNPVLPASDLLRPGPIGRVLQRAPEGSGRVVMLGDPSALLLRYEVRLSLFGEQVQGYGPTQLPRYWALARAVAGRPLRYNRTVFPDPPPAVLDLLQVGWVVVREDELGQVPASVRARLSPPVAQEGPWELRRLLGAAPPATFQARWRMVAGPGAALAAVTAAGFDPSSAPVVLEGPPPGLERPRPPQPGAGAPPPGPASVRFGEPGPGHLRAEVEAPTPGVLLVRVPYHPNWRATVDGRRAAVLPAEYLDLGVPVPGGRHVVELRYQDPLVWWGLAGSGAAVATLLGAWALARRRARRLAAPAAERRSPRAAAEPASPAPTAGSR